PGTGARRPGRSPAGRGHVRDQDAQRRLAGRTRAAAPGAAALAGQGPAGRARRREHRGAVREHLSGQQPGGRSMTTASHGPHRRPTAILEAAVLQTSGLGKRYGRRWALSDCTLTVPPGRVTGLVGPNGAGKTTLLHIAV